MIRKKRLIRTLQALIRINSENPAGNEQKIASWVYDYIKKLGITAHMRSFQKRRPNVIASIKRMHKDGVQRSLLITPHLDTVPAGHGWHHNPFGAESGQTGYMDWVQAIVRATWLLPWRRCIACVKNAYR